jgi:hypothetical protein
MVTENEECDRCRYEITLIYLLIHQPIGKYKSYTSQRLFALDKKICEMSLSELKTRIKKLVEYREQLKGEKGQRISVKKIKRRHKTRRPNIMHMGIKKDNHLFYLCNQAVIPFKKKITDNWDEVTCTNCLFKKPEK